MRVSQLFNRTIKEDPADIEIVSHSLLIRSGMIRKSASGIFSYLPLGWRVINKINNIIREEMNRSGCQEVMLPILQSKELWEESGRWDIYGKELIRLHDRHGKEYCLSPTHEEVITNLVKNEINSYKDLPLNLYQIQNKYRDEVRPRFGLIRSREFLMKDGYSFNLDDISLEETYLEMYEAYKRIFTRCGLNYRVVEADSGAIGGSSSHEFMVLAENGEAGIVYCNKCEYAANMELAKHQKRIYKENQIEELKKVKTPDKKSIQEVSDFLKIESSLMMKTMIYKALYNDYESLIAVVLRGNREVNPVKLKNATGALEIKLAANEEIEEKTNLPVGFIGPIGLNGMDIFVDEEIMDIKAGVTGGMAKDIHLTGVNPQRDFPSNIIVGDFHNVDATDSCPECGSGLDLRRGIEVGQVFKLGTRYSEKFDCKYRAENGTEQLVSMGCYGIGIGRTMAASIEQNHDKNGIIWPKGIAPYHVIIIPVNIKDENIRNTAEELYKNLLKENIEVIIDDTEDSAGIKFVNSDLIGYPIKIVVGKKTVENRTVDFKIRATGEEIIVPLKEAVAKIKRILL